MGNSRYGAALEPLSRLFGRGTITGLGEGALLERFAFERDEAAFEAIVTRHGPMVLGICRRGLDDPHDVEDAFQATFLVLVRKAGTLRESDQLAPWLFGVARKVTARTRSRSILRRGRERSGVELLSISALPDDDADRSELRSVLDEEIGRLPEKYRAPVVLCYLEGLTHDEAAQRLRCPVGTVRSRMSWARQRLRVRLDRRGLAPAGLLAGPGVLPTAAVPAALTQSTVAAASGTFLTTHAAGAAALAKGVLTAMFLKKLLLTTSALAAAGLLTTSAAVIARQGPAAAAASSSAEMQTLRAQNDALQGDVHALREDLKLLRQQLAEVQKTVGGRPAPPSANRPPNAMAEMMSGRLAPAPNPMMDMMSGMMSGTAPAAEPPKSTAPRAVASNHIIAVVAPESDRVFAKSNSLDGRWSLYRAQKGVKVSPVLGDSILPLQFEGTKITELAVYLASQGAMYDINLPPGGRINMGKGSPTAEGGKWYTHKIDPPAEGLTRPLILNGSGIYIIGTRIFGFSAFSGEWKDVTTKGKLTQVQGPFGTGFQDSEALYVFEANPGVWKRIDWASLEKEAAASKDQPANHNR